MGHKKLRCVVTGGNGFIGSHLVYQLLGRGFHVTNYDIGFGTSPVEPNLEIVRDDIRNLERLKESLGSADSVFHLAGLLGTSELFDRPREAIETNIFGALNVLLATSDGSRSPTVFFPAKYNDWNNVYSVTAQAVEKLGHAYRENMGIDVRVLRLPNVYGPRQKSGPARKAVPYFITQAVKNQPIEVFGNGKQLVELIYVDDVVKSIIDFAFYDGPISETYELVATEQMSVEQLARHIVRMTQSSSQLVYSPMRRGESHVAPIHHARDVRELVGSFSLSPIESGMQKTIDWYRKRLDETQA